MVVLPQLEVQIRHCYHGHDQEMDYASKGMGRLYIAAHSSVR